MNIPNELLKWNFLLLDIYYWRFYKIVSILYRKHIFCFMHQAPFPQPLFPPTQDVWCFLLRSTAALKYFIVRFINLQDFSVDKKMGIQFNMVRGEFSSVSIDGPWHWLYVLKVALEPFSVTSEVNKRQKCIPVRCSSRLPGDGGGRGVCPGEVGGVCLGGCLPWGSVCSGGCLPGVGVSALGGVYLGGVCLGGVYTVDRILDTRLWNITFPQLRLRTVIKAKTSVKGGKNRNNHSTFDHIMTHIDGFFRWNCGKEIETQILTDQADCVDTFN